MATGGLLAERGFKFWDMGMALDYKIAMGGLELPRAQFRSRLELARKCAAAASLPRQLWEVASQSVARVTQQHKCVLQPLDACESVAEVKEVVLELRARGAGAERIQAAMARIKQMMAATAEQVQSTAQPAPEDGGDAGSGV
jgi:hypothetical protein